MSGEAAIAAEAVATTLARAVEVSRGILAAADAGEAGRVLELDAERRALLASVRADGRRLDSRAAALLEQIRVLNDEALGRMQHGMRRLEREFDTVKVGRRALAAYASAGARR